MTPRPFRTVLTASACFCAVACGQTLDAGATRPHGLLPVDERNPVVLMNDGWSDNWAGEYAVLLANGGGPKLAGIVVNAAGTWSDLDENVTGWRALVAAARESGLSGIPDPIASISDKLVRPASGVIEDTLPNRSEGALFILRVSSELSRPYRPLVVATGGRLTDVADAYLIEPALAERIVVVSSLGELSQSGAAMGVPNGEMDPWADAIVSARLRYVQVNAYYDQLTEVPASRLGELPSNALGAFIAAKQPQVYDLDVAADQVAVLAAGFPAFVTAVARVSGDGSVSPGATEGPELTASREGPAWLVTEGASALAVGHFWELLLDRRTYAR